MLTTRECQTNLMVSYGLKGLYTFSSSVMFVSLALFLYSHLHLDKKTAAQITGSFFALNYGLSLLAGYIGTHYVSFKRLYVPGLLCQSVGYLLFSQVNDQQGLLWLLPMILLGNMVSSVSIVEFIGYSTAQFPELRRSAMQYNYASMNVGNILGTIVSGVFSLFNQFHLVFLLLSIAPLSCAILAIRYIQYQATVCSSLWHSAGVLLLLFNVVYFFSHFILIYSHQANYLLFFTSVAILIMLMRLHYLMPAGSGTIFIFGLYLCVWIGFWAMFFLTPTILMTFIKDWVILDFHGLTIQPQWLDTVGPIEVVLLTPILAYGLGQCNQRLHWSVPSFSLFGVGLFVVSIASWGLAKSISIASFVHKLPMSAIVFYIGGMALAEVLVGPEGYTLPGKLAPERFRGLFTGILVASVSVSSLLSSGIAGHMFDFQQGHSMRAYHYVFDVMSLAALIFSIVVLAVGLLSCMISRR